MKTSRWRCDRARCLREDGLISIDVNEIALSPNVGRQWHRPVCVKIEIFAERDDPLAFRQNFFNAQRHVVDLRRHADARFASGFDQTFPARWSELFQKQKLD